MRVFAVVYLILTLGISIAIIRALVENWKNYDKSQRCYMLGFLIMLSGMTQRAFGQVMGEDKFQFEKSGLIVVGLSVVMFGVLRYGRDPRLQEPQASISKENYEALLDILAKSQENRKLDKNTESTVDNGFDERHSSG